MDLDIQKGQNMSSFFLHREAYVRMLTIDIYSPKMQSRSVLSGLNKTYRPHHDDKMGPQDRIFFMVTHKEIARGQS